MWVVGRGLHFLLEQQSACNYIHADCVQRKCVPRIRAWVNLDCACPCESLQTICFIGRGRMWMEWKVPLLTDFTEQLWYPLISRTSGIHTHTHLKLHCRCRSWFSGAATDIALAHKPKHSWWGRLTADHFYNSLSLPWVSQTCHRKVKVVHYLVRQRQLLKHPLGVSKGLTNSQSFLSTRRGVALDLDPSHHPSPSSLFFPSSPLPLCPSLPVHFSLATDALVAATAAAEGEKYSGRALEHNEALQGQS